MNSEGLTLSVEYAASAGIVFSTEQKAALQTSLVLLQNAHKFHTVQLWGKIVGIKDHYFIACGVGRGNELNDRKFLYSQDCMKWCLLPILTDSRSKLCRNLNGRFIGDPSYEYEHIETKVVGEGEDAEEETNTILVKEEDRLAAVISEIDVDVHIVPRGSYVKTPNGKIVTNRSFEGLNNLDCKKLCSYFHFKDTPNTDKINLLAKATLDQSIDFLEHIENDLPKGCWALQAERGNALVILKSLLWLGYCFYHVPGTKKFGSLYIGTGEKNIDLPFML